jgi:DNA-binding winged helix-turn-helix (wHTH) protein/pimeloyl-ACP methyl ester carboxylesterase
VIYIFDNYTLDGDKRELRDGEVVVQLQPQVFDLLEFLLRNRDRVVSKDEMLAAVWGGRIVSESTLASRINAARSAIGDNGEDQRLIRTFLRKGVRFVGQAREVQASSDAGTAKPERLADGSVSEPSALPRQAVTFCQTGDGANLAVASVGNGPVLVRAAHWGTHIEYDLQNPLTGPLLQRLAGHFHLVRYDGRCTGLSDCRGEISFETFLDDLETVVDSLGLERFVLLGMHSGAAVSIAYAVRYPKRVSKLVLLGGYAQGHQQRDLSRDADWAKAMTILVGSSQEHPVFIRAFSSLWLPSGTPEQVQWFMDLARVSHSSESQAKIGMAVGKIDVIDLLPMVNAPTIVFHCIRDNLIPFSQGRLLACSIPNARFVPLDSENHALLSSEPAWKIMMEEMKAFLADGGELL